MVTLKGPTDAEFYRTKVGRSRWYYDPLPADSTWDATDWKGPSVSATKPPFANKYVPMKTIAQMDDFERLAGMDPEERYEHIKTVEKLAGQVNMDRGSIVHQWAEDLVIGQAVIDTNMGWTAKAWEQAQRFRPALEQFFNDYQPEPTAIEVPCLHRTLNGVGYGGTADLFAVIEGENWVVDWKSRNSAHGCYFEEAAQGGAYVGAEYMIVLNGDGDPVRVPTPDANVLIVSITDDSYRCYPVDRDDAVRGYTAMHEWWTAQQSLKPSQIIGKPWAPKAAAATGRTSPDRSGTDTVTHRPVAAVTPDAITDRLKALAAGGHTDLIKQHWPAGVPTMKQGGHTTDQLELLMQFTRRLETEVGAPFNEDDTEGIAPAIATEEPSTPVKIDEGGKMADDAYNALRTHFNALSDEQKAAIGQIVREAKAAGANFTVKTNPTIRTFEISRALIGWASMETNPNHLALFTEVVRISDNTSDEDFTLGAVLASFTIEQAKQLAEQYPIS